MKPTVHLKPIKVTRFVHDDATEKLGDRVERVLKPWVRGFDRVVGTDLGNCGGCGQRKEILNTPDKTPMQKTVDVVKTFIPHA